LCKTILGQEKNKKKNSFNTKNKEFYKEYEHDKSKQRTQRKAEICFRNDKIIN
jgi:hypothetical protein